MTLNVLLISNVEPSRVIRDEFSLVYRPTCLEVLKEGLGYLEGFDLIAVQATPKKFNGSAGGHPAIELLQSAPNGQKRVYITSAFRPDQLGLNQGVDYDAELRVPYAGRKFIEMVNLLCQ